MALNNNRGNNFFVLKGLTLEMDVSVAYDDFLATAEFDVWSTLGVPIYPLVLSLNGMNGQSSIKTRQTRNGFISW